MGGQTAIYNSCGMAAEWSAAARQPSLGRTPVQISQPMVQPTAFTQSIENYVYPPPKGGRAEGDEQKMVQGLSY